MAKALNKAHKILLIHPIILSSNQFLNMVVIEKIMSFMAHNWSCENRTSSNNATVCLQLTRKEEIKCQADHRSANWTHS